MRNLLREKRMELYPRASFKKFCEEHGLKVSGYKNWEFGVCASYTDANYNMFRKMCEALQITEAEGKEAISNNYQARKNHEMGRNCKSTLNNPLSNWRIKEGLQQKDVAELMDVNPRTYSQWEEGRTRPTGDNLKKLLELTGLSVSQLAKIYVDAHPEGTPIDDEPTEENNLVKAINVIKNDVKEVTEKKAEEPKPEEPKVNPKWPQNFIFGCISIRKDLAISTKDDWVHKELYSWLEAGKDNQYSVTHKGFTLREVHGIELYFKEFGHTFDDVGKSFGVTRERARQIILKAQRKFAYHIHLMLENDERDRKIIQEELTKAEARSNREFTLEIKQDANGCPYTDDTPIEQAKVTARDENGKAVAGRYPWGDPKKIIPGWYGEKTKIEMTDPSISGKLDSISDWLFQISNEVTELKKEKKTAINPEMFTAAEKNLLSHVMEICYGKLEFGEYNRLRSILGRLIEREE